jgi:hypothetical protein
MNKTSMSSVESIIQELIDLDNPYLDENYKPTAYAIACAIEYLAEGAPLLVSLPKPHVFLNGSNELCIRWERPDTSTSNNKYLKVQFRSISTKDNFMCFFSSFDNYGTVDAFSSATFVEALLWLNTKETAVDFERRLNRG